MARSRVRQCLRALLAACATGSQSPISFSRPARLGERGLMLRGARREVLALLQDLGREPLAPLTTVRTGSILLHAVRRPACEVHVLPRAVGRNRGSCSYTVGGGGFASIRVARAMSPAALATSATAISRDHGRSAPAPLIYRGERHRRRSGVPGNLLEPGERDTTTSERPDREANHRGVAVLALLCDPADRRACDRGSRRPPGVSAACCAVITLLFDLSCRPPPPFIFAMKCAGTNPRTTARITPATNRSAPRRRARQTCSGRWSRRGRPARSAPAGMASRSAVTGRSAPASTASRSAASPSGAAGSGTVFPSGAACSRACVQRSRPRRRRLRP